MIYITCEHCGNKIEITDHVAGKVLGKKARNVPTERQQAASRENGKKGGRKSRYVVKENGKIRDFTSIQEVKRYLLVLWPDGAWKGKTVDQVLKQGNMRDPAVSVEKMK